MKLLVPAFKTKIVLEVLRDERKLGKIFAAKKLNSNTVYNWKHEFLDNVGERLPTPFQV